MLKKKKKNCYGPVGPKVSVLWKMFYFCIQVWGRCFMLEEQTSHPRNFSVVSLVCHAVIYSNLYSLKLIDVGFFHHSFFRIVFCDMRFLVLLKKKKKKCYQNKVLGTSLVVQWLRLPASSAGWGGRAVGSIPSQGTKIPHVV